jgi:RecA-family ATPase
MSDWLVDAADLLAEPDPGPTPWLVEGLIVDQALAAVVGKWKTTKSWGMLEVAVSIATGTPAFGTAAVPQPGPVVYVIEESGRRALWRRLDSLCRGHAIHPDQLRDRLLLAANARVKLDDPTGNSGSSSSARSSAHARSSSTRSPA